MAQPNIPHRRRGGRSLYLRIEAPGWTVGATACITSGPGHMILFEPSRMWIKLGDSLL